MNQVDTKRIVEMQGIRRHYGDGVSQVKALDDVDLSIQAGEFVAIVGASGSGKSTLLQILGCLDRADSGQYLLAGKNVLSLPEKELARVRNEVLGFVFQSFYLLGDRNALDNVRLPLEYRRGKVETSLADQLLETGQLSGRGKHFPSQLSGGERQRVAIARALVKQPQLLLCDEPTGNLDSRNGQQILDLLSGLREEYQTTLVLVTHDTEVADRADRVMTLRDGRWSKESSR